MKHIGKSFFEKDDETKKYWDREITAGRSRKNIIDIFFYAYLQIKIEEPELKAKIKAKIEDDKKNDKKNDKTNFTKIDSLFQSYKKIIKDYKLDRIQILKEIKEYAELFRNNFDYEIINRGLTHEYGIERIIAMYI